MPILIFSILISTFAFAGKEPPNPYIDKGGCPGECCHYGAWNVEVETKLYDKMWGKKVVATVKPGDKVEALRGEVHVNPVKVKVHITQDEQLGTKRLKEGEEIYLLGYQGDDGWKVWKNGEILQHVLENWKPRKPPQSVWWVEIKPRQVDRFGDTHNCQE